MTGTVEVTVRIPAEPDEVFRYFTDSSLYVRWMGSDATLDPVPGGSYRVRMPDGFEAAGNAELAKAYRVAWETHLPRLEIRAAGGDPGPDPHAG
jgi:hypothetical protein